MSSMHSLSFSPHKSTREGWVTGINWCSCQQRTQNAHIHAQRESELWKGCMMMMGCSGGTAAHHHPLAYMRNERIHCDLCARWHFSMRANKLELIAFRARSGSNDINHRLLRSNELVKKFNSMVLILHLYSHIYTRNIEDRPYSLAIHYEYLID